MRDEPQVAVSRFGAERLDHGEQTALDVRKRFVERMRHEARDVLKLRGQVDCFAEVFLRADGFQSL